MIVYRPLRGFGDEWDNITEATSLIPTPGSNDGPGGPPRAGPGSSWPGAVQVVPAAGPAPGFPGTAATWLTSLVGGGVRPAPLPMYQPPPSNTGLYLGAAALGAAVIYLATRKRT